MNVVILAAILISIFIESYDKSLSLKKLLHYIEEKKEETNVVKQIMNKEEPLTDRFIQLGYGPMQGDDYFNLWLKRYHDACRAMVRIRRKMILIGAVGMLLLAL